MEDNIKKDNIIYVRFPKATEVELEGGIIWRK